MKYLKVVALLICLYSCHEATKKENTSNISELVEDSLVNYSYMITSMNDKVFCNTGTGFIVHYKDKYFVVSNYHVFTGKYAKTNKKIENLPDTAKSIIVVFRSADPSYTFHPMKYELFGNGNRNFSISIVNTEIIDITVMPIELPNGGLKYFFEVNDLDTSISNNSDNKMITLGFPNGNYINNNQPTKLVRNSVKRNKESILELYLDDTATVGMSGSPVYLKNNTGIKVKSVLYLNTTYDPKNPSIKAASIFIKYVLDGIKNMYDKKSVTGIYYKGR